MDASTIIDRLGGTKAVIELTGLSKGRISHWRGGAPIPRHWLLFFATKIPELQAELDTKRASTNGDAPA